MLEVFFVVLLVIVFDLLQVYVVHFLHVDVVLPLKENIFYIEKKNKRI
jgi:hypothetical protein